MKNKILTLLLILTLIIPIFPQYVFAGAQGNNDAIPGGGISGRGGGIYSTPAFRVGLISEEFRKPLDFDDKTTTINEQIINNYDNHFPNIEHSIIFCPSQIFKDTTKQDLLLKKYFPSCISLLNAFTSENPKTYDDEYAEYIKYKVIEINNSDCLDSADVFYTPLFLNCPNKRLRDLQNGKWLDILSKDTEAVKKSYKIWNYILKDWESKKPQLSLNIKLNSITHYSGQDDITDEQKFENELGYLQLLMTLYAISPPSEQDDLYLEIERYVKKDHVKESPPIIAIDTVTKVTYPSYSPNKILMSSLDYMMFVASVSEGNNFTSPTAPVITDMNPKFDLTRNIIRNLVTHSMNDQKDKDRITNIPASSPSFEANGFAWGQAGVIGKSCRLYTGDGEAKWNKTSKTITGTMEALKFTDNQYGFMLVSAQHVLSDTADPTGDFSITTPPPPEVQVKGENPTELGEVIKTTLTGKTDNQQEKDWSNALSKDNIQNGFPQIKIELKVKMPNTGDFVNAVNTPYPLTNLSEYNCNGKWQYISKENLLKFMQGNLPIEYIHVLENYPVKLSTTYVFEYMASIRIRLSECKEEEEIILKADPTDRFEKIFYTPQPTTNYYSIPTYASEIKQGSIYHESFEAMAGTPTTRDLYFSTGGSEFIAEIKFQYKPDQEAVRQYTSKFTGTPCEFKKGDQAGEYTVPSPSGADSYDIKVNVHGGDCNISATWKGDIPNDADSVTEDGMGTVTATCPAEPNWDEYEADKDKADNWAETINKYTISHKAASDGITRKFNSWGAYPSPSPHPPTTNSITRTESHQEKEEYTKSDGTKGTRTYTVDDPCTVTADPNPAGSYTITVNGSVPLHAICGPCCCHDLRPIQDNWEQEITYDTIEITDVNVWKIQSSKLNGMYDLLETDEVTAKIVQGDPNVFYNIASSENSRGGRIRYSLEPQQHDHVIWNEGARTNKCDGLNTRGNNNQGPGHSAKYATGDVYTNKTYSSTEDYHKANSDAKDKNTDEYKKFDDRRHSDNIATIISDFVILQTSSGDQSLLYFDKKSEEKNSQQHFDKVSSTFEEMLDDNPESCIYWQSDDRVDINVGSYNGEFLSPKTKYSGTGDKHRTKTIFDPDPAHTIRRPSRPTKPLRLTVTGLDIIDTFSNGEYITGKSSVFYKNILNVGNQFHYFSKYSPQYQTSGLTYTTKYQDSDKFTKINDIVIHNPVSAEKAIIYPVDESLDQRVYDSDITIGGNLQSDITEYITRLKDIHPYQNFIINGDAEELAGGKIVNWLGESDNRKNVIFKRIEDNKKISGKGSFYIEIPSKSNGLAKYVTTSLAEPNINYTFTGKMKCHNCNGSFLVEALDCNDNVLKKWSSKSFSNSQTETAKINFNSPYSTSKLRVSIINNNSKNINNTGKYVIADDLSITKENGDKSEWVPNRYIKFNTFERDNPDYVDPYTIANPEYQPEQTIKNPNYVEPSYTYQYSGNYQEFTVPVTGTYTLEVWGAQGSNGSGGLGGYASGKVDLTKGEKLYIYTGGSNGFNGGGSGHGRPSQCGGGGTDIRRKGNSLSNRIIVAGGGGGRGDNSSGSSGSGGAGGGTIGGTGGNRCGSPGKGGSQSSGGSGGSRGGSSGRLGFGGSNNYGSKSGGGGGGGGYYGGGAGGNDETRYHDNDDSGGGGGSGYIGGVYQGSMKTGIRQGNGCTIINAPAQGESEYITIPAKGEPTITINNANYVPAVVEERKDSTGKIEKVVITPAKGQPYIEDLASTIVSIMKTKETVSEPPDNWYETILETIPANPTVELPSGEYSKSGDMLILDRPFKIFFPNKGNFYDGGSLGLSKTTTHRGKGFTNNMDTTEWTTEKIAKFDFNVIYNDILYPSGSEIQLKPIDQNWYDFYLPLANSEAISANAKFYSVANNGSGIDNNYPTNKKRYIEKNARHSALKRYNTDIVGRIGNIIMEDTGDFRFSNLFKEPLYPTQWYIPNVIPKVEIDKQNKYMGSIVDIRGESVSPSTNYLNTYGTLDFLQNSPLDFPLSPSINNIEALKRQPLRIGYPVFMDIQTIGNYYSAMQITPYYYSLNLLTGKTTPLDVYMNENGKYQPINIFDNKENTCNYPIALNWEDESARRNYTEKEKEITQLVRENTYTINSEGEYVKISIPIGSYHSYGNTQIMNLNERNRTFIGSSSTYDIDRNPGKLLSEYAYKKQAQRWHFTFKLPSSTVFVPHGSVIDNNKIDEIMNNTTVVIAAAKITAIGDTYCLEYEHQGGNGSITVAGKTHSLDSIPYTVYAIYSSEKSSANDLTNSGTH